MQFGLAWDFRPSFRRYVRAVAQGHEELCGGAAQLLDGTPYFPLVRAVDRKGVTIVQFAGELAFIGHLGAIDVRLRAPQLDIYGDEGALSIDLAEGRAILADVSLLEAHTYSNAPIESSLYSTHLARGMEYVFNGVYRVGDDLGTIEMRLPSNRDPES